MVLGDLCFSKNYIQPGIPPVLFFNKKPEHFAPAKLFNAQAGYFLSLYLQQLCNAL